MPELRGCFQRTNLRYLFLIPLLIVAFVFPYESPRATTDCDASVTPREVPPSLSSTLTFRVNNPASDPFVWVNLSFSDPQFTITGGSGSGWTATVDSASSITFTNGTIPTAGSATFTVTVTSAQNDTSIIYWPVQVSNSSNGSDPGTCSGDTYVSISTDSTPPTISDISIASSANTAIISWTTDETGNSTVRYGPTDSYGSTATDGSYVTSHSLTLTGLSASMMYHYQIESADASGNSSQTADVTFTTSPSGTTVTTTTVVTHTVTKADTTAPQITLQVPFSPTYKNPPAITGTAVDDTGVTSIQFSTDDGKTWRGPVENVTIGVVSTPLSFKPTNLKDGVFKVKVRATDAAGNVGMSTSFVLTIDQKGPKITVYNAPNAPVQTAPDLSAIAEDTSGFQSIQYSTDNGVNWTALPFNYVIGATQMPFAIVTGLRDDGNYSIHIRATDTLGNTEPDTVIPLVIDRLPPIVGGNLLRMGSFVFSPAQGGSVTVPVGVRVHLVLSAVGGATSITLTGQNATENLFEAPLILNHITDSALWWTEFRVPKPGSYTISAHAIDGALNTTDRVIATITAFKQGLILGNTEPISGATTTVYVFDQSLGQFILWDGTTFDQTNPQTTDTSGRYSYFLPAGKYSMTVRARGYRPFTSAIFTLATEQPVSPAVTLTPGWRLCLGSWCLPIPDIRETTGSIAPTDKEIPSAEVSMNPLIGKPLPEFVLEGTDGSITPLVLRGRDTVLTFMNTWWPQAATQLSVLDTIEKQGQWHSVVLIPEESRSFVVSYRKRGGYMVPMVADSDGSLINIFQYQTIPMHILINQQGQVLNVIYGLLYPNNLVDNGGG